MSVPDIPGVLLRTPELYPDHRGFFSEIHRASNLKDDFVQANHSRSKKGVLRGLHYHRHQSDLWYVATGRAQVALVDLRHRTATPDTAMVELGDSTPGVLLIPPGVAHGYLALEDLDLIYLVTSEFDGSDEHGVAWNDPVLGLEWATSEPILSARDRENPELRWDSIPQF